MIIATESDIFLILTLLKNAKISQVQLHNVRYWLNTGRPVRAGRVIEYLEAMPEKEKIP